MTRTTPLTPLTALLLGCVVLFAGCATPHAGPFTLRDGSVSATIDPATLHVTMTDHATGQTMTVSHPQPGLAGIVEHAHCDGRRLLWVQGDIGARAELVDGELALHFEGPAGASVAFPVLGRKLDSWDDPPADTWLLPIHEGHRIPEDDADWATHLAHQSPTNTVAGLSVPFLGLMPGDDGQAGVWILEDPLNNTLAYTGDGHATPIGLNVTHRFNPAMDDDRYRVRFCFAGESMIGPALAYRAYLQRHRRLVTLVDKIADNPRVDRLRGALHAYVWDDGLISAHDLEDAQWLAIAMRTASELDPAESDRALVWSLLDEPGREAVIAVSQEEWPSMYQKRELAAALSRVMLATDDPGRMRVTIQRAYDAFLDQSVDWGDGVSMKMLLELHSSGIERALLLTGGLHTATYKAVVPALADADEFGYLFGPYDSYHSIHAPDAAPDDTWDTAQFDQYLWDTGGIRREDGTYSPGFRQRGRHLSPLAARPYVEERVNTILEDTPHSAWFVDCDAYGELFDDYSPGRLSSKYRGMEARLSRLRWLSDEHGLVVGSEGGSAYAVNAIHFAHGVTTPVIGWGDPRLKERDSEHYLGGWWPPHGPAVFFKQVPLAPGYEKIHFDPRYRLPLYQAVFHDCVVATHHWGYHSHKFTDQVRTVALTEQLYNTPPLVHLNLDTWQAIRGSLTERLAFFAPIHREAALLPLTDFRWLDDDGLVQQTYFGERYILTVNFDEAPFESDAGAVPPHTAVCLDRQTGAVTRYSP